MQRVAKEQGLNVYPETLRCEVKAFKGPFAEHEDGKGSIFYQGIIIENNEIALESTLTVLEDSCLRSY